MTVGRHGLQALSMGVVVAGCISAAPAVEDAAVVARSLVSQGDTARLQHALAKARRGGPVSIGVIGGSITQGAKASKPELRYGELVGQWWTRSFPQSKVTFHNAGIGATGTNYGALRVQRDLLSHHPDFVISEYSVNDGNLQASAETFEGMLRQILAQPQQPAVLMLCMMNKAGGNAQEWHSKVGRHYGLPIVSYRDALWPEIQAGRLKWTDISPDEVHPNDLGHEAAAQFVIELLAATLKALPADAALPAVAPQPQPLLSDRYEHVWLAEAGELKPTSSQGFTLDTAHPWPGGWKADQLGSRIEFEVEGTVILFMEWRLRGPLGKAKIQVDDRPAVIHDAWFEGTWGGYRLTTELGHDLAPGKHKVRVEVLEDKNPLSTGHEYRVMGLGSAGR